MRVRVRVRVGVWVRNQVRVRDWVRVRVRVRVRAYDLVSHARLDEIGVLDLDHLRLGYVDVGVHLQRARDPRVVRARLARLLGLGSGLGSGLGLCVPDWPGC